AGFHRQLKVLAGRLALERKGRDVMFFFFDPHVGVAAEQDGLFSGEPVAMDRLSRCWDQGEAEAERDQTECPKELSAGQHSGRLRSSRKQNPAREGIPWAASTRKGRFPKSSPYNGYASPRSRCNPNCFAVKLLLLWTRPAPLERTSGSRFP